MSDAADGGGSTDDGVDSMGFIVDDVSLEGPCDPWAQNCPPGYKCAAWSNSTGWDATRCVPLDPRPAEVGEACTIEGGIYSGMDNCALGAMCWWFDWETLTGTCAALCVGTPVVPACEEPGATCSISNSGSLILCMPLCDPLIQDCAPGHGCYAALGTFMCAMDGSKPGLGTYGDACEYLNGCEPGLFCAEPDQVPACEGAVGCCSEFCGLGHPDGDAQCSGASGGQRCVAWHDEGQAPPELAHVGACILQ